MKRDKRYSKITQCGELLAEALLFLIEKDLLDEFGKYVKNLRASLPEES